MSELENHKMLFFGEIVTKESGNVKIMEGVEFDVTIIGSNARVVATHHVKNTTDKQIDAVISMTLDDESCVTGFELENNGKVIISQLKEKEEAKQEQSDASANGYSSAVIEKTDDTTFTLSLGLIDVGKEMTVRVTYLTKMMIDGDDVILKFPPPVQSEMNYNVNIHTPNGSSMKFSGVLKGEEDITVKRDDKGMIVMRDEDLGETIAASTFVNKEEEGKVEVIFVCDRSGSMTGEGIDALKETLQLFLRQLPEGSKFNIISFGSRFESMFKDSVEYTEETMKNASVEVKGFQANYGGTSLLPPLESAMKHKCQIIVMTDGEAFDKSQVMELCKKDHDNIVHMVGLGNNVDTEMVRNVARLCGGISAISKNPMKLKEAISRITSRILTPIINEPKAEWSVKGEQYPENISKFNADTTVFMKYEGEEKNVTCELRGKVGEKEVTMKNESSEIQEGTVVEQLYAAKKLRDLEANDKKEEAIKLSLKYGVLSKYTAFISVDKSNKQEVKEVKVIKLSEFRESYDPPLAKMAYSAGCGMHQPILYSAAPRRMYCKAAPQAKMSRRCKKEMVERKCCKEKLVEEKECVCEEAPKILSKHEQFNKLVELQKFNGSFESLLSLYPTLEELVKKYNTIDSAIVMTIVGITLFEKRFADMKTEWNLLYKKAMKFLDKQTFDPQLKVDAATFVASL